MNGSMVLVLSKNMGYSSLLPINMQFFDLSHNMFEGPIHLPRGSASVLYYSSKNLLSKPSIFSSHLSDITLLKLSQNKYSGNIPPSFCGAMGIQFLDLSKNN